MGQSDLTIASTAAGGAGEWIRTAGRPVLRTAGDIAAFLGAHAVPLGALVVVMTTASVVAAWRRHHRCLGQREARILLPTDSFDPKLEEIARFWAGPAAQTRRRREWTRRRAEAIRFCLSAESEVEDGLVTHTLSASPRALALLEPNAPHQVELERPQGATTTSEVAVGGESRRRRLSPLGGTSRLRGSGPAGAGAAGAAGAGPRTSEGVRYPFRCPIVRARAELTIAPGQTHALAQLSLDPDPLTALAGTLADLADGEAGYVALDLQPLSGGQLKAARRRARQRDRARPDWVRQLTSGAFFNQDLLSLSSPKSTASASPSPAGALRRIESREETMTDYDRFAKGEPVFSAQLLIWAEAASKTRARAIVDSLVTGFAPMNQRAHWTRTGFHLGPIHLGGADSPSRRRRFDHRAATGCHRPARPSIVGASEIAGLIKPPSVHCHVSKVLRGGGLVPPPPTGLPTWAPGTEDVIPVGEVTERGVRRWIGVYLKDTFFTAMFGKSRYGKALALDTPIPSPTGWTTMGAITEGQQVFDDQGRPCSVTLATDVMYDHPCYLVEFSDGSSLVADADHRWLTLSSYERAYAAAEARRIRLPRNPRLALHIESLLHTMPLVTTIPALTLALGGHRMLLHGFARSIPPLGVDSHPGRGKQALLYPTALLLRALSDYASTPRLSQLHKRHPIASVRTTAEIAATVTDYRGGNNHAIPVCGPLEYPGATPLPIDPYAFGAWLGDGTKRSGEFTTADDEMIEHITACGYNMRRVPSHAPYGWVILGIYGHLTALGVRGAKHIPACYLQAPVADRWALLQGLMDTDGSVTDEGNCELSLTCKPLVDGAHELIVGLGIKVTVAEGRATLHGRDCGPRWRLCFSPPRPVFRLSRKLNRQLGWPLDGPTRGRRYIVAVRPVPSVPVRCIAVDSPSHLFLAGASCIPTHNTNAAIVAMIALARLRGVPGGRPSELRPGFAFLDPHGDGIDEAERWLVAQADRVRIVDLRRRKDARQAGWNPLSMVGRDADEIEDTVSMMVAGFSAVLGWSEVNNRAQNLLTQAVASLCQLNMRLPPELQATMFQIPTILTDEAWRDEILRFLPTHLADFWTTKLKTQTDAKTATSPVTNLCDRLRASNQMAALFGQSVSTFDMRRIMDDGSILLLCPGGAGDKEKMAHVLILFEMFRAATSRHDLHPADRRRFDAFLDEMQVADKGSGSDYITRMFREAAKFGLRIHAMAQQPDALSAQTLAAIADNRSHLSSTTVGHRSATWLAQEFGKDVEPSTMTRIRAWHRIASVSLNGVPSKPFRVRNLSLLEAHGEPADDAAVAALEATVDANMGRLSVAEVLAHLETLDSDILAALRPGAGPRPPRPGQGAPESGGRRRRAAVEVPAEAERSVVPPAELPEGVASIVNRRRSRGDWSAG